MNIHETRIIVVPTKTNPSTPKRKSIPGLSKEEEVMSNDNTKTGIAHTRNL
ncbi:hypothetical protein MnTg01_00646 [archaeon MnTg01]|nr:hypothetical protein MnTg01_00646 [archaeon MnTg01]